MEIKKVCDGLLSVDEDRLQGLINSKAIADVYDVEQTPFARGKFAAVRKCTHKTTGIEYAAKFIRKRRRMQDQRRDILHEVAVLLAAASCPKIVSLHEVFETNVEMVLVLELVSGGELQRVVDVQEGLGEEETVRILRQLLVGLSFLHERNIAHLDIKPQNILLIADAGSDVKLCDFGISRVIQEGVEVREILGTPDYVAPEILSFEPISLRTDIWSIGILAYVLLSGYSPFAGDTKQETFCNISQCNLTFPDDLFLGVSSVAQDFISRCLVPRPNSRMSVKECLAHPWLSYSPLSEPSPPPTNGCAKLRKSCRRCVHCQNIICCHDDKIVTSAANSPAGIDLSHFQPQVDFILDRSIIC